MSYPVLLKTAEAIQLSKRLLLGEALLAAMLCLLYFMGGFLPEEFGWLLRGYLPARAICCAASLRILVAQPQQTRAQTSQQKDFPTILLYGHFAITGLLIASMALGRVLDFGAFVNALAAESVIFGLAWGFILPDLAHAAFKDELIWADDATGRNPQIKQILEGLSSQQAALQLIGDGHITEAFNHMIQYWEKRETDAHQILLARRSEFVALQKETQKGALSPTESRYQVGQIRSIMIELAQKME